MPGRRKKVAPRARERNAPLRRALAAGVGMYGMPVSSAQVEGTSLGQRDQERCTFGGEYLRLSDQGTERNAQGLGDQSKHKRTFEKWFRSHFGQRAKLARHRPRNRACLRFAVATVAFKSP